MIYRPRIWLYRLRLWLLKRIAGKATVVINVGLKDNTIKALGSQRFVYRVHFGWGNIE